MTHFGGDFKNFNAKSTVAGRSRSIWCAPPRPPARPRGEADSLAAHDEWDFTFFFSFQRIVWRPKDSDRELCLVKGKPEVSADTFRANATSSRFSTKKNGPFC